MRGFKLAPAIAHRGVPTLLPENSAEGFELAAKLGYEWAELDLQGSSDGVAVVHHDLHLADGRELASQSVDSLLSFSIGKDPETGKDIFIPTFVQILASADKNNLGLVVEIKASSAEESVRYAQLASEVLSSTDHGKVIVSSFHQPALAEVNRLQPHLPLALNIWETVDSTEDYIANIHCNWESITSEWVAKVKQKGYLIYAYTVNSPQEYAMQRFKGVDGVFTDEPAVLEASASQL